VESNSLEGRERQNNWKPMDRYPTFIKPQNPKTPLPYQSRHFAVARINREDVQSHIMGASSAEPVPMSAPIRSAVLFRKTRAFGLKTKEK
jgi:hypothetical protein